MTEEEAIERRDSAERRLLDELMGRVEQFAKNVIDEVKEAFGSESLIAAADPFAFTNVMKRWRDTIRDLYDLRKLEGPELYEILVEEFENSDLPQIIYDDVMDVLARAKEEDWSQYRTTRWLNSILLPKQGDEEERSTFRARVRSMARRVTTRSVNHAMLQELINEGYSHKRWVARLDDVTRDSHETAHGQIREVLEQFSVGDDLLLYPGESVGTAAEVLNCRCVIVGEGEPRKDSDMSKESLTAAGVTGPGWEGVICVEGKPTGDGRLMEADSLEWESLPLPFRLVTSDVGAHDGAVTAGLITAIERRKGGMIWARGVLDADSDAGREAARQVSSELTTGVSVDLDNVSFEIRVASEVMQELEEGETAEIEVDDEGRSTVLKINSDDELMVVTKARIRAATLVPIPAFIEAKIGLVEGSEIDEEETPPEEEPESLVASGAPLRPPKEWFEDPQLTEPTGLTVTEDGRLFGHLATWDTCHIGFSDLCVTPPTSTTGYSMFHVGALECEGGELIGVGHITMGTGHAATDKTAVEALAHYDNTGSVVADVRAGEDAHGIWVAGALRPHLKPSDIRALRSAPLSGDWRSVGGNLELVAALAVNVPGFPVPRPSGMVASGGRMASLTASGMVPPKTVRTQSDEGFPLSEDDLKYLKHLAQKARTEAAAKKAAVLRQRVRNLDQVRKEAN